jgi:uncharacterized Zn finger protein (UPF0148 family)
MPKGGFEMKYCPYCGTELVNGAASFCTECGKSLQESTEKVVPRKEKKTPQIDEKKPRPKKKRTAKTKNGFGKKPDDVLSPKEIQEDFGYDGYYDDIVPSDIDREREGIDKELVKRISIITGVVLIIIGLCITALYLL